MVVVVVVVVVSKQVPKLVLVLVVGVDLRRDEVPQRILIC